MDNPEPRHGMKTNKTHKKTKQTNKQTNKQTKNTMMCSF